QRTGREHRGDRARLPRMRVSAAQLERKKMSLSAGRILVTGAGGFIGSHLTEHLIHQGNRVRAFLHYNSAGSHGWLEHSKYSNDIEFFSGDVRDFDSVHRAMEGCSMVFHLAALISIPYSYISPQ